MNYDPDNHLRRSIRLQDYDYSQAGAYFVTIVAHNHLGLFGEIMGGDMRLNAAGEIVQEEWRRLGQRFPHIHLGAFVVMPYHIHGIITIRDMPVGATRPKQTRISSTTDTVPDEVSYESGGSPLPMNGVVTRPHGPPHESVGAFVGQFKSRVTKRLWVDPRLSRIPIWQRNYYEHIIRSEDEYQRIHRYIEANPINWMDDDEYPERTR
jgi:REP element-mobilizing transposase RayT